MKTEQTTQFVILQESVLQSWARDIGTFGSVAAMVYVNHVHGGGSLWVDGLAAIAVLAITLRSASKGIHYMSKQELADWAVKNLPSELTNAATRGLHRK